MSMEALLRAGVKNLGLDLSEAQVQTILDYQALITKWNKVYNLTAIRDEQDMLHSHLLDSLAVVAPLSKQLMKLGEVNDRHRVLDVGSGAGLPGVILAICLPQVEVTCVDTVGKKAAFIRQTGVSLGLSNLIALHARVESLNSQSWDVVCSRAFASLTDFTTWSESALKPSGPSGVWMAMKGKYPEAEIAALGPNVELFHVEQLTVPGLDADRCLLWLRRKAGQGGQVNSAHS